MPKPPRRPKPDRVSRADQDALVGDMLVRLRRMRDHLDTAIALMEAVKRDPGSLVAKAQAVEALRKLDGNIDFN